MDIHQFLVAWAVESLTTTTALVNWFRRTTTCPPLQAMNQLMSPPTSPHISPPISPLQVSPRQPPLTLVFSSQTRGLIHLLRPFPFKLVKGTATLIQTVMLVYFACSGMVMNQFLVAVALHSDIGTIASVKYTDQALNHLYPPFQAINHQPDKLS